MFRPVAKTLVAHENVPGPQIAAAAEAGPPVGIIHYLDPCLSVFVVVKNPLPERTRTIMSKRKIYALDGQKTAGCLLAQGSSFPES